MFKSFFPNPKIFFTTAMVWIVTAIFLWVFFVKKLILICPIFHEIIQNSIKDKAINFITINQLWFYIYYWFMVSIFACVWNIMNYHPWQRWSIWGSALIIFVTWFGVQVGVAINIWYGPFYDLIQQALTKPGAVQVIEFYHQLRIFLGIGLISVIIGVMNSFFISHWVFRWRTAMNNYYIYNWQLLRIIEGAAQRVQEDTMRFANTLEDWGVSFIQALMTLIAFLPLLVSLSYHITDIPILGNIPHALLIVALIWSIFGTILLALVGIKLPGLEFRNQRVEAAYRKELVYGEDDPHRASPVDIKKLFGYVRYNYFRLYLHYLYFNITRILYLQIDNVFGLFILFPSIASGTITLGLLNQITNVFDQVRSSFQYLITSWSTLVELLSIYKRLRSFEQKINRINEY